MQRKSLLLLAAAAALGVAAAPASAEFAPAGTAAPSTAAQIRDAFRAIFAAIRARDWTSADTLLAAQADAPLAPLARAELWLADGAPGVEGEALAALVTALPDLPEAPALVAMARARGITVTAALPAQHEIVRYAGASKRLLSPPSRAEAAAARLAGRAGPLARANDGAGAEALVEAAAGALSPAALTEWRQRVAWAYYLGGDDANAVRVATLARGGDGEWATQGAWVQGLAAWRSGDKAAAADAFNLVAARSHDPETIAAGLFWQARALGAGVPGADAALRSAARLDETFYGLLAAAALGTEPAPLLDPDALAPAERPNLRFAAALAEIGETQLADQLLRHQAKIGDPVEHGQLVRAAQAMGLTSTQMWLAANGPRGGAASAAVRYPLPAWQPSGGWRVDRALLLAHALQESRFRADASSPAGARGLMQLMPATAQLVARHKGDVSGAPDRLADPAVSFEYGQSYLEELAANPGTGGLLPKVIAAYNAGPNNVAAWGTRPGLADDPLLFIESIPFVETRGYVAIVLRNYWMYQRETGIVGDSRTELAAGRWPRFPLTGSVRTATVAALPAVPLPAGGN